MSDSCPAEQNGGSLHQHPSYLVVVTLLALFPGSTFFLPNRGQNHGVYKKTNTLINQRTMRKKYANELLLTLTLSYRHKGSN